METHGYIHDIEAIHDQLPLLGTDIDRCDEEYLDIEIFPDRPDLLSGETLAVAIRHFLHRQPAPTQLNLVHSDIKMTVDHSLIEVRPVIYGAVVKGVNTGTTYDEKEAFIKAIMDHQEKLHFALGRGRKRASIGVHDLATLKPPMRVVTVGRDFEFTPLGSQTPLTIENILSEHPKGMDYAHLLDGMDKVPVILDSNNAVLSFPPIINGDHTTVTHDTTDFFIDVTGWDEKSCECALLLICLQLQERGGTIHSIEIQDTKGRESMSPNSEPQLHHLPKDLLDSLLGRSLTHEEIQASIQRMGGQLKGAYHKKVANEGTQLDDASQGSLNYEIEMPRWRFDLLHPIDLVEEIAIGHGYEDLGEDQPKSQLTGKPRTDSHLLRRIRESMQGMGFMQIQSLSLSNMTDQFSNMRWDVPEDVTMITNPITIEHTILRQHLLPGLMKLLSANRHHDLPQSVYELGAVVRGHKNHTRLAFLTAEKDGGFAAIRGRIQSFMRDLGIMDWDVEPTSEGEGPWLGGRGAKVLVNGNWVGCFGELDPRVSSVYELRVPLNGAEFDIQFLSSLIEDPV